jgi:uncharacterized protein (DUF2342 family)
VTNFTVDVGSLDRAASTIHTTESKVASIHAGLHEIHIPHGTFGRVPWLSDQIAAPYDAHVKACSDAIKDIEESLGDLAEAVTTTANNYRRVDSANIDQALQIERELYES